VQHLGQVFFGAHIADHLRIRFDPSLLVNRRRLRQTVSRVHEDASNRFR
jgi:hypothetical protein